LRQRHSTQASDLPWPILTVGTDQSG
jgi:hypothetical protein